MYKDEDVPIDDPTECPYYLISRASLVITSELRLALNAAGIKQIRPSYLGALWSLWVEDGLKVVELGRRAGLEASTMTGLLDRMERDGLVARVADPEDRRALRINLTKRGKALKEPVQAVVDETLERMFSSIAEPDLNQLKETLRSVLTNSNKLGSP